MTRAMAATIPLLVLAFVLPAAAPADPPTGEPAHTLAIVNFGEPYYSTWLFTLTGDRYTCQVARDLSRVHCVSVQGRTVATGYVVFSNIYRVALKRARLVFTNSEGQRWIWTRTLPY